MLRTKAALQNEKTELGKPGVTPEEVENQCIALATNLVKERLLNGTASAQEVTHFLKLGSSKAKLEKELMKEQKDLYSAKKESLLSTKRNEEMLEEVKIALQRYRGEDDEYENSEDIYGADGEGEF